MTTEDGWVPSDRGLAPGEVDELIRRVGIKPIAEHPDVKHAVRNQLHWDRVGKRPALRVQPSRPVARLDGELIFDERSLLYSIIELMALGLPVEDMPPAERTLLERFLGNVEEP